MDLSLNAFSLVDLVGGGEPMLVFSMVLVVGCHSGCMAVNELPDCL